MALFGAPIAHEDSARRAVAAALRMQATLEQYGSEMAERHDVACRFRVGLNTGPVVVGTVTDDLQMNFTAIGDTANLAARMEQVADPGSVFISEPTHGIIGDFFDCEPLGELAVKGKSQPGLSWRGPRGETPRRRVGAAPEQGVSPVAAPGEELAVPAGILAVAPRGAVH